VTAGSTYTCTPNGSGSVQVTVPARVNSISITADGGGGGKNASYGNGGSGARVSATVAVTPGNVLTVYVGAGGGAGLGGPANVGGTGYGAGGNGGAFYGEGFGGGYGGGGGGSSAVLVGATVKVVAGGGGGGGRYYGGSAGAAAGLSGGGSGSCAMGGGGGNAAGSGSAGGTSGSGVTTASTTGFQGKGGNGTYGAGGASSGGGGGGAGYGGGGAGNWNGPYSCTDAGGGGAGGSYGPGGAVFESAANAGGVATAGAGGDGQVAISFIAPAATAPGPPTDLVFSDISTTAMTAYWSPPGDDGGSAVTGYDVTVTPGTTTRVTDPEINLTGLSSGTTYTVSVTAVNDVGSSATALSGTQQTSAPGTPTAAATNMVFSGVTTSDITATWTAPAAVTGWPTLGYQVRVDGGSLTWVAHPTTTYTATGLSPGTSHTFSVTVVNGAGSSPVLTGIQATDPVAPGAPTNLVFSNTTDSAITANWQAPGSNGGSAITKYTVSVDGNPPVDVLSGTSYIATGLSSSAWHTFSVKAVNVVGPSASDLWGAASTSAPPNSPRTTASSVTVGGASTITLAGFTAHSTQTVQVTAPDSSMSTFTVTVDAGGSGTGSYTATQAGSYSVVTAPAATSATFTASVPPAPQPSGGSPGDAVAGTPAAAPNEAVPASSAPRRAPSIRITGRAGRGARAGVIFVSGTTTGLAGSRVIAHVRLPGRRAYALGGSRRVDARGRFTWQRRATGRVLVYFTSADGGRSNRVTITGRRP